MSNEHFDLIAIGGGSAARDGARKAKDEFGARVALIESTRWGGDCPNVACRPTKAYLVAADLLHDIQTLAPKAGIEVGPARADLAKVKARNDAFVRPSSSGSSVSGPRASRPTTASPASSIRARCGLERTS